MSSASPIKRPAPPTGDEGGVSHGASNPDDSFRQYRRLCEDLEKEPSYNSKTKLVQNYIKRGNSGGEGGRERKDNHQIIYRWFYWRSLLAR